mmetsp:Transcript_22237/g.73168  ORF Transcript_22237/g.73168 Transcript_22237/m.73168 type:complete len:296 (-) Transcript_22237:1068-1955(-)
MPLERQSVVCSFDVATRAGGLELEDVVQPARNLLGLRRRLSLLPLLVSSPSSFPFPPTAISELIFPLVLLDFLLRLFRLALFLLLALPCSLSELSLPAELLRLLLSPLQSLSRLHSLWGEFDTPATGIGRWFRMLQLVVDPAQETPGIYSIRQRPRGIDLHRCSQQRKRLSELPLLNERSRMLEQRISVEHSSLRGSLIHLHPLLHRNLDRLPNHLVLLQVCSSRCLSQKRRNKACSLREDLGVDGKGFLPSPELSQQVRHQRPKAKNLNERRSAAALHHCLVPERFLAPLSLIP